jgi:exopolysaccharide production protein ExoZ
VQKLVGLQYLRAFAAISVLWFHAAVVTELPVGFGTGGVDLFFVLSGFLMWVISDDRTRPADFLIGRLQRIVPIYWIATILLFGMALAGLTHRAQPDWAHFLTSLFFIPYIGPGREEIWPLLLVGWTLNYEMFFYVVFAAVLLMARRVQAWVATAVFIALVLLGMFWEPTTVAMQFYTRPIILEFVAGIWLGVAWRRGLLPSVTVSATLCLVGLATFLAAGFSSAGLPRLIAFGVPSVLMILGVLGLEKAGRVPVWRVPEELGDASYSIYIWHNLIIAVLLRIVPDLPGPVAFGLFMAAGILGGVVAYRLLEKPIVDAFKARRGTRLQMAPAP